MATKVKVSLAKGSGDFAHCEISAGTSYDYGNGTHDFEIGVVGAVVHFLTVSRNKSAGDIKITAATGDVVISVDGAKDKKVSKGKSLSLSSKNKRAIIRETVKK